MNKITNLVKRYYKVNDMLNVTHLKVDCYYKTGGPNMFTYQQEPRGYYMSIRPVRREEKQGYISESFTCFTGGKRFLFPVPRRSKKRDEEAIEYFVNHASAYIKEYYGDYEIDYDFTERRG